MHGLDVKHLRAVVILAEERHLSRAAARLRIGQSGLTKQIVAVEMFVGFLLFVREPRRVTLTPAGEVFVAEAKIALHHVDRAMNLSKSAFDGAMQTLHVGKSPHTDPFLITKLLSLRFPLFPHTKVHFTTKLAMDLKQELLDGSLDLAFLTGIPNDYRLTGSIVADQRFFVAMLEGHPFAELREVKTDALQNVSCIMFERHVQPHLYDEFVSENHPAGGPGCTLHHAMSAEDALQLMLRNFGVAVLTQAGAWRVLRNGVTIRPLTGSAARLKTELVAREDNESRLVSDVVRCFMRSLIPVRSDAQFRLNLADLNLILPHNVYLQRPRVCADGTNEETGDGGVFIHIFGTESASASHAAVRSDQCFDIGFSAH